MVMPLGDVNPTRRVPVITWTLALANLAVFLLALLPADDCTRATLVFRYGAVPATLTGMAPVDADTIAEVLGACAAAGVEERSALLALVTSLFLHGSIGHLLGNLLFLAVFGDNVEDRLGRLRFLLFYVVAGVVATGGFVLVYPASVVPLIGASGAIAGILGAYLLLFPRAQVLTLVPFPLWLLALVLPGVRIRLLLLVVATVTMPAWLLLLVWLGFQTWAVGQPLGDPVAYEAHLVGFAAGILLLLVLDGGRRRRGRTPFHPSRRRHNGG